MVLVPIYPQIRPALIDTEDESSDEEPIELVVVVLVADSSDKPITTETELEDPTDNAVAVSESDIPLSTFSILSLYSKHWNVWVRLS
jgi:hypothetical protein